MAARTIKIFYCYAHEDDALREQLARHLSPLRRLRYITAWFDREIQAGTDWEHDIETHLDAGSIILLLVSSDFMASDYCYTVEMMRALEKHAAGTACVLPIILRPVHWEETPIGALQALPTGKKPVTQWADRDEAWLDVVRGIREIVRNLLPMQILSPQETRILYPEQIDQHKQRPAVLSSQEPPPQIPALVPNLTVATGSGTSLICPQCGFQNRPDSKYCKQDGYLLEQPLPKAISPLPLSQSIQPQLIMSAPSTINDPNTISSPSENASDILRRIRQKDIPVSWRVVYPLQKGLLWRSMVDSLESVGGYISSVVLAYTCICMTLLAAVEASISHAPGAFFPTTLLMVCGILFVTVCLFGVSSRKTALKRVLVITPDRLLWGDWLGQPAPKVFLFQDYAILRVNGKALAATKVVSKRGGGTKTKQEIISIPFVFGSAQDLVRIIVDAHEQFLQRASNRISSQT